MPYVRVPAFTPASALDLISPQSVAHIAAASFSTQLSTINTQLSTFLPFSFLIPVSPKLLLPFHNSSFLLVKFSFPHSAFRIPQFFCPPIFILNFRSRSGYCQQIVKNKGLAIVPRLFQAILSPSPFWII
jgi:hypothetical protein